jgi:hypothetical protein
MREKESFFGDFLPISKKLPAPWSGSLCSQEKQQSQSAGFPLSRE